MTRILDHFDLSRHFAGVFGSELDGTHVDKGDLLRFALAETGARRNTSMMIGDRSHDAIGAASNGIGFLAALYGYGSTDEFQEAGVTHWVERPIELVPAIFASENEPLC